MANAVFYSNLAIQTTLSGSISSSATSITVGATTGFPSSFPYTLALDFGAATEELVSVTAAAGTTLTVTRGYGGTSAQSHSLGAVVRHVYDATDATAFRTHEAATAAVHGVAGTLVGTSDTQTLSNKTLTSPTINGAAVSGTFTGSPTLSGTITVSGTLTSSGGSLTGSWAGTPTFSGDHTYTGQIVLSNLLRGSRGLSTDSQYETRVTADTNARWFIDASGKQWWGPGNASLDTNLYRSTGNTLKTDDSFVTAGSLSTVPTDTALDGLDVNLPTGTVGDLLNLRVNSTIQAAMDSSGVFRIYGGNAPTTYTPTVTNGGTVTWTTRTGYWWRVGKIVFVVAYLAVNAAGSGTSTVAITMPSSVDRSTRQVIGMSAEGVGLNGHSHVVFFTGGTGATSDRIRSYDGQNLTGADLLAGGILTIQGWYREA